MSRDHWPPDGMQALEAARSLYERTLAAWVGDLLALRKAGGGWPGWVPHDPEAVYGRAA